MSSTKGVAATGDVIAPTTALTNTQAYLMPTEYIPHQRKHNIRISEERRFTEMHHQNRVLVYHDH